jgi:hypothetical protein
LIYNNGSEFKLYCKYLCKSYGIKRKPTTVKDPQANGILERVHQVLGQMLRTAGIDIADSVTPDEIDVFLDNAAWAIHSTYHTVLKASPGAAIFGRLVGNVGNMSGTCRADTSMLANFPDISFFCRHPFLPIWPFPRVLMSGNADISIGMRKYKTIYNTRNCASKKPLRLLENTTDVLFPRREFVRLYRGTLSPLLKTGVFLEFFYTPRLYTASYLQPFFC